MEQSGGMKFKTIAFDKCSQPNLRNTTQEKEVELHELKAW